MHRIFGGEILQAINPTLGIFLVAGHPIGRGQQPPEFGAADGAVCPFIRVGGGTARHRIKGPVEILAHVDKLGHRKMVVVVDMVQEYLVTRRIVFLGGVRGLVSRREAPANRTGGTAVIEIGALHRVPIDCLASGLHCSFYFFHSRCIEIERREKLIIGHRDRRCLTTTSGRGHGGLTDGRLPYRRQRVDASTFSIEKSSA